MRMLGAVIVSGCGSVWEGGRPERTTAASGRYRRVWTNVTKAGMAGQRGAVRADCPLSSATSCSETDSVRFYDPRKTN